jgi:histidinol-phosphatase (PHP family)
MEWGIFDFITHPDIMLLSLDRWDSLIEKELSRIPAAAERTGTPLEINAYGMRKPMVDYADGRRHQYPVLNFWKMASTYRISCVIGSDAHKPEDVFGNSEEAYAIAEKFNIPCVNADVARKIIQRRS